MNYLPDLRSSLVDAARKQYADAAEPAKRSGRRRRPTTSGVATALASAIAVAVALVAVASLSHRRANTRAGARPTVTRTELRRAAAAALNQVTLPAGATVSALVRGTPIGLWSASDQLRIPNHVDVYRIWRIHGRPDRVITFIETHRQAGFTVGFGGEGTSGSGYGGQTVVDDATVTISLPPTSSGVWRQLAIDAVSLSGGGTALRIDSEAGWLRPRPVSERIPAGVARVAIEWAKRGTPQRLSLAITKPNQVRALVSLFNSLPSARSGTGLCKRAPDGVMSFSFEGAERNAPLAVAAWAPPCQDLGLAIDGRSSVPLMAGAPTQAIGEQIFGFLVPYLAVRRVSGSRRTIVNSSQRCVTSKSTTSGRLPSAPGAAGASCTSVSHSTRSASSP